MCKPLSLRSNTSQLSMEQSDHQHDAAVKQLLGQARGAIQASNASQALQFVVQALKLIRGDNAVIPTLREAAEQYHTDRAAPIEEISALLAQVSLQAEQQQLLLLQQQQQQQQQHPDPLLRTAVHHQHPLVHQQQQQHLQNCGTARCQLPSCQERQDHGLQQQQELQQKCPQRQGDPGPSCYQDTAAILNETGRGEMTSMALADGSSWQCPYCAGVVPLQRQQAHLSLWCPQLQNSSSGADMTP